MVCKLQKSEGIICPFCLDPSKVYLGHDTVRYCKRCLISWGASENVWEIKKAIISEEQNGALPEDIVERVEIYQGQIGQLYRTQQRIDELLVLDVDFENDPDYQAKAVRDWQSLVNGFTPVMKLIHLAMRLDSQDEEAFRRELLDIRRREYEEAVSDYMHQVGCEGRAFLDVGPELKKLDEMSRQDARSIGNTYNFELGRALVGIKKDAPRANRYMYARRLGDWEASRAVWKNTQIAMFTQMSSRQVAMEDFVRNNGLIGGAVLVPGQAAEEICQGWINRGVVPIKTAQDNPSPFHIGCIHYWQPEFEEVGDCFDLWVGGS
jgi:hypothetical protein